jgi:hypothetical protein
MNAANDQKLDHVRVPKAARELLNRAWIEVDAESLWAYHRDRDQRSGQCYYHCREKLSGLAGFETYTLREVRALVKAGAIPESLVIERPGRDHIQLNQHASHSLQQFLYECGTAYARHLERMRRWKPLCDESEMAAAREAGVRVKAGYDPPAATS